MKARGNEMSETATRFLTSTGILYGHIFHDEFLKNLKKYTVFIILILQKCQRKLWEKNQQDEGHQSSMWKSSTEPSNLQPCAEDRAS